MCKQHPTNDSYWLLQNRLKVLSAVQTASGDRSLHISDALTSYSQLWTTLNTRFAIKPTGFFIDLNVWTHLFCITAKGAIVTRSSHSMVCPQGKDQLFGGLLPRNPLANRDKPSHSESPDYWVLSDILNSMYDVCCSVEWLTHKKSVEEFLFLKYHCYIWKPQLWSHLDNTLS